MNTLEGQFKGERALVDAAKASREGFGLLYDRYVAQVYRYAYARTGSHQDAEDVTSETFRRALEHIESYEWHGSPFLAWLYRIAGNTIVDRHRKERPQEPLDQAIRLADGASPPDEVAVARDEAGYLWSAVAALPRDQRRAVVLRFSYGLKGKEIARVMGRTEASVKQLLYRATVSLREKIAKAQLARSLQPASRSGCFVTSENRRLFDG